MILLFMLCVLLPMIPLAYLAVRSMTGEPESISGKIKDHLERVGLAFAKTATAGIADCEEDLVNLPEATLPLNESVEEIAERIHKCPVFNSFFVLDSCLEPLFPFGRVGEDVPDAGSRAGEENTFAYGMKEGNRREFCSGDPEKSIRDYGLALSRAGGAQYRAVAENAIARCCFKQGKYREAKKYYTEILKTAGPGVFYGGLSLNLLARYRLAVIDAMLGYASRAVERYLDTMGALAGGELAGSVHEAVFYASMAENMTNDLLSSERLDRQYRREFEELLKLWRQRKTSALEIGRLKDAARSDLQKLLGKSGEGAPRFSKIPAITGGMETILLCSRFRASGIEGPLILVFVLDSTVLRREFADVLNKMLKSEGDVNAAVYDSTGRIVVEGGDEASGFREGIEMSLAPVFPFWQLKAAYRKQGLLFEVAAREKMTRLSSILFLVTVILLGLYVTCRSIKRDTELARMKGEFVSRVSHELRTPLATIRAVGEMLEMGAVSSREKEKEYFRLIASESERLSRLIDNVLDFSKIGTKGKTYSFRHADVKKTVSSTVRAFRQYVRSEGFDIVFQTDDEIPETAIDEDAVSQALINLLDNAVKFSREEKVVVVELRRRGDSIAISVRDRGIGIAPEDIDKIFDQFYRPKESAELSGKGAGIGLAIVRHVAEAHGGRVEVQSKKGRGTLFTLVLPVKRHYKA